MLRPNEHAADPWRELLVTRQIVLAESAHTEQLSVGRCDKRERQTICVQVRTKLATARLECLFAENMAVVIQSLLRKSRNEFRVLR